MKFLLNQGLHREQHIAVRIVEQIERGEDNQRGARLQIRLGHGSSEYSTARGAVFITVDVINDIHYYLAVIKTFADKVTATIWSSGKTRGSPPAAVTKAHSWPCSTLPPSLET